MRWWLNSPAPWDSVWNGFFSLSPGRSLALFLRWSLSFSWQAEGPGVQAEARRLLKPQHCWTFLRKQHIRRAHSGSHGYSNLQTETERDCPPSGQTPWDAGSGSSSGYQGTGGLWGPDDLRLALTSLSRENETRASPKQVVLVWRHHEWSLQREAHAPHCLPQIQRPETVHASSWHSQQVSSPPGPTAHIPGPSSHWFLWTEAKFCKVTALGIIFFFSCEPDLGGVPHSGSVPSE